jgi:hypothetical protein
VGEDEIGTWEGGDGGVRERGTGDRLDGGRRVRFPRGFTGFWLGFCVSPAVWLVILTRREATTSSGCSRAARPKPNDFGAAWYWVSSTLGFAV